MTTVQKSSALIMGVIALIAIYYLQSILTPFLIGIILAYLGDPVVDRLVKYKVNRTFSVLIVFVVFLVVMVGAALVVVPMLVREVSGLIQDIPAFIAWLQEKASPWLIATFNIDPFDVSLSVEEGGRWMCEVT